MELKMNILVRIRRGCPLYFITEDMGKNFEEVKVSEFYRVIELPDENEDVKLLDAEGSQWRTHKSHLE